MSASVIVAPAELERFVGEIFLAAGVDSEDAAATAEHVVLAQMRGHHSHGMLVVPQYLQRLRAGVMRPRTEITVVADGPASAILDGASGWGVTIGKKAMLIAMAKAKEVGIAIVAVRNSSHAAMMGYYPEMASKAGMIGFCFATPPRLHARAAPWGGKEARLGTNPLSIAVPAGRGPDILLDMATTQVAQGKIMVARTEKKPIPLGWALDKDGNPTTDAEAAMAGVAMPLGGYKGYGLAVMIELLCGLLSADDSYPTPFERFSKLYGAINLSFFQPLEEAKRRVDEFVDLMKGTPRMADADEILLPGEPEVRNERASREGVVVGLNIWSTLVAEGEALGVVAPEARQSSSEVGRPRPL